MAFQKDYMWNGILIPNAYHRISFAPLYKEYDIPVPATYDEQEVELTPATTKDVWWFQADINVQAGRKMPAITGISNILKIEMDLTEILPVSPVKAMYYKIAELLPYYADAVKVFEAGQGLLPNEG